MMMAEPIGPGSDDNSFELPVSDARARLAELVEDARHGQVIYLTRYGHHVAAIVPAEMAENQEQLEDAYWAKRAAEVLAKNGPAVPWEQAIAELESGEQ